jgi:hypothetical protein
VLVFFVRCEVSRWTDTPRMSFWWRKATEIKSWGTDRQTDRQTDTLVQAAVWHATLPSLISYPVHVKVHPVQKFALYFVTLQVNVTSFSRASSVLENKLKRYCPFVTHYISFAFQSRKTCYSYVYFTIIFLYIGGTQWHLVEALRYKPGGRGFEFRWGHWNFPLT